MPLAKFTIEGMHCEACAGRIRPLLQRQQGVREASVPCATGGDAWIRFNPRATSRERLAATIAGAGFRIVEGA